MAFIILIGMAFLTSIANQTTGQTRGGSPARGDVPYNHPVNVADTCVPSGSEIWELTGVPTDSFNYGFGFVNKAMGEFSSDFSALNVVSITLDFCGYKNDTIADTNPIQIGIYNQIDGSLRQSIGTVSFDSIPFCTLNQAGTTNSVIPCSSKNPAGFTVTGSYQMLDAHSPGGIDYIGVSFPAHSAVGHDVVAFCASGCSSSVVSHGGICSPHAATLTCSSAGGVNSPGFALAGAFTFTFATNTNVTSSPGLVPTTLILPLFAVGAIGLFAIDESRRSKHGGIL